MSYTKASNKAVQKYCKKAYSIITLRVKKGEEIKIKEHAKEKGMSLNSYINKLITDDLNKEPPTPP